MNLEQVLKKNYPEMKGKRNVAKQLKDLAKRYQFLQIAQCNRPLNEAEEMDERELEQALRNLAKEHGLVLSLDGDPRGHVVNLKLPQGDSNNMGGEDWGI